MNRPQSDSGVTDGDQVPPGKIGAALTAGTLVFEDGSTQVFSPDGDTVYVDHGRPTEGTWSVADDGRFSSFWPPAYRAYYTLEWVVEGAVIAGLTFIDSDSGRRFVGRYQ